MSNYNEQSLIWLLIITCGIFQLVSVSKLALIHRFCPFRFSINDMFCIKPGFNIIER